MDYKKKITLIIFIGGKITLSYKIAKIRISQTN